MRVMIILVSLVSLLGLETGCASGPATFTPQYSLTPALSRGDTSGGQVSLSVKDTRAAKDPIQFQEGYDAWGDIGTVSVVAPIEQVVATGVMQALDLKGWKVSSNAPLKMEVDIWEFRHDGNNADWDEADVKLGFLVFDSQGHLLGRADPLVQVKAPWANMPPDKKFNQAMSQAIDVGLSDPSVVAGLNYLTDEQEKAAQVARLIDRNEEPKAVLSLRPIEHVSVSDMNGLLLTWKNEHLADLLSKAKTEDLLAYADEIEHTMLEATDAAAKEKDIAETLVQKGTGGEGEHTDLSRAFSLRIDVLKPILAAIKDEISNRSK
jgi:hypothetical protein